MNNKNEVMVIEDDVDLAEIFSEAFNTVGFQTTILHDGGKAMTELNASALPRIIILDLHLPNVDGVDILAHIRSRADAQDAFVIVTTADAKLGDTVQDKADLVLIKPVSFVQMRNLAAKLKGNKNG